MTKIWKILLILLSIPFLVMYLVIAFYLVTIVYWMVKYPNPNCQNTNKIFSEYSPETSEYKTELTRLLKKTKDYETSYWFGSYIDSEHVSIFIQNNSICARGHITINEKLKEDGGFMKRLMKVKGASYNGPLTGVEFEFSNDKDNPEIFLVAIEDIID